MKETGKVRRKKTSNEKDELKEYSEGSSISYC